MNTLTLLGAGASIDAGVPGSTAMTQQIVEALDTPENRHYGLTHAINYAVGAMIAHRTANGANAYAGIDVEDLFSAVQMLAERESLEIAPFVQWSPALAGVRRGGGSLPPFFDKDFREGVLQDRAFKGPGDMIRKAVEALTGSNAASTEQLYDQLQEALLSQLTELVSVTDKNINYLHPLLESLDGTVEIATLNYDRSIELLCDRRSIRLDTGIANWSGGGDWSWDKDAEVRLLKVHGSIDWQLHQEEGLGGLMETKVTKAGEPDSRYGLSLPGVVFGARGKLRADGPFLPMLREFENMLARADRLLVVGYSFRDAHINVALTKWINSAPLRDLSVIDPAFDDDPRVYSRDSFSSQLLSAADGYEAGRSVRKLNLRLFRDTAARGLLSPDLWSREPEGNGQRSHS